MCGGGGTSLCWQGGDLGGLHLPSLQFCCVAHFEEQRGGTKQLAFVKSSQWERNPPFCLSFACRQTGLKSLCSKRRMFRGLCDCKAALAIFTSSLAKDYFAVGSNRT